jgi:hypothetical protein
MLRQGDFSLDTKVTLAKRASYICSNPNCRGLTVAPSLEDESKVIYNGEVAHIISAALKGPRNDATYTNEQRSHISNGIFLCSNCATMIDKNDGVDFPVDVLREWKEQHNHWIRENLNKNIENTALFIVDGEHHAKGIGEVTGLHLTKPTIIKPGTISTAEGIGNVTATKIG